jgi:hypothetical protein
MGRATSPMHEALTPEEAAEERRLWADYYEASAQALELMRAEGTSDTVLLRIVTEHAKAASAMKRIKEIRGVRG